MWGAAGSAPFLFVDPASDGHVSILWLFGAMIGPFSERLMRWVHEAGHCDDAMLGRDWVGLGDQLIDGTATADAVGRFQERYATNQDRC